MILFAACAGGEGEVADEAVDWAASGPHAVGYASSAWTWSEPGLQDEPRTGRLAEWYPTDDSAGDPVVYGGLFDGAALGGATPIEGELPTLVFSHGHQAYAEASSFLAEHFASHGWRVLAPDHTWNTTFDDPERDTPIYRQRPLDLGAAMRDAPEVVVVGHSFGGYTAHAIGGATYASDLCASAEDERPICASWSDEEAGRFALGFADPRVVAVIAMAPGDEDLFGPGLADVGVPELLMTGGLDEGSDGDTIWAELDGADDVRVHLPDGGHNAFTDFSGLLDPPGTIDPEEGFRIVRGYALAFASKHLLGDPAADATLSGERPISDQAVLTRR